MGVISVLLFFSVIVGVLDFFSYLVPIVNAFGRHLPRGISISCQLMPPCFKLSINEFWNLEANIEN